MFLLTQLKYRLFRAPVRSILLLLIALLLGASMGLYLGSIQSNEAALRRLSDTIPVKITVINRNGDQDTELAIEKKLADALTAAPVHHVLCTADAAGAFGEAARSQEEFTGGDMEITAANDPEALNHVETDTLTMLAGYEADFLSGKEALCLLSDQWARENGVNLGDEISIDLYAKSYTIFFYDFSPLGEQKLKIVGTYRAFQANGERTPDAVVPVKWLRGLAKEKKSPFTYSSLSARLDNPLELTRFKSSLKEMGFTNVRWKEDFDFICDAVSVEDELFIKTAENLQSNLKTFRGLLLPFFGLATAVVALASFLVLRGGRKDMAIALSLGESRWKIGAVHFLGAAVTELVGCCLSLPVLAILVSLPPAQMLGVLLLCLGSAYLGTVLAIALLLRFEPLSLLTKID